MEERLLDQTVGWFSLWLQGLEPVQVAGGVPWWAPPLRVHSQSELSLQPRNSLSPESLMLSQAGREWGSIPQEDLCMSPVLVLQGQVPQPGGVSSGAAPPFSVSVSLPLFFVFGLVALGGLFQPKWLCDALIL